MGEIPAIAANSTATAVAAEAAAEVEATAADTKSGPRSGISVFFSAHSPFYPRPVTTIYYGLLFLFSFARFLIHTTPNIFLSLSHYLPMFMETWTIKPNSHFFFFRFLAPWRVRRLLIRTV
jgi:hypothetical protein